MLNFQRKVRKSIAVASLVATGFCATGQAAAVEQWRAYTYNAVATVTAVKGLDALFETIQKETGGERCSPRSAARGDPQRQLAVGDGELDDNYQALGLSEIDAAFNSPCD